MVEDIKQQRDKESRGQRKRRRDKSLRLKIGHGGTLDPMATGVLIIGIGRGTKYLTNFLNCTKSYTTTMLFGAATDTYDILGKVLSRAPYEHVTRAKVEEALPTFRGETMQTPPIYSALKQDGKKLYEYAREGKEPPREIQQRSVTVEKLEIVEWLDKHDYRWPREDAPEAEKEVAQKVLHLGEVKGSEGEESADVAPGEKRKRDHDAASEDEPQPKRQQGEQVEERAANGQEEASSIPPAVSLDMTVTSGFYVRSLCHDLGKAIDSHGLMAELVRSRQGDYILGQNVFEYDDLSKGEDEWGPKIRAMLEGWLEKNPVQ